MQKISARQTAFGYYDDANRCRNCRSFGVKRRWRKVLDSKGEYFWKSKIEEYRCLYGEFPISANGICRNYERKDNL
jgi:hypothetical protein